MRLSLVRALLVHTSLAAAPLAALSLEAAPLTAQQARTSSASAPAPVVIVGRVTVAGSRAPIAGATVSVQGASLGATTDSSGRYRLSLPATMRGTSITVDARRIGYRPVQRTVRVDADSLTIDFALRVAALKLSAVTVDGMAASVQARSLGSTIAPGVRRCTHDCAFNTEAYDKIDDNPFLAVRGNPRSTFSIDVDRASYSNVRRFISYGQRPPKDAVRIEELVNYFSYDYPDPAANVPFAVTTDVASAPWNPTHRLVRIGLQGRKMALGDLPPSNLVFLIDVSGSMQSEDKLPLLKSAFRLLVNQLRPEDHVAIVVYAGAAGLVLPSTPGNEKRRILDAIDSLEAGGSTAGGAGLRLAYDVAKENRIENGINRVILATDGDFNVGVSSDAEMVRLIEEKREQGTSLTVLGFGTGNLKDSKMEKLADHGNGHYAYVDSFNEARKVFVREIGGTLATIAKDVKVQVEFNPTLVTSYRLIGYENRMLRDEDFNDDKKDAGDLGAGHSVTALYEVIPVGAPDADSVRKGDPLRYQSTDVRTAAAGKDELLYVKLRYKEPEGGASKLLTHVVRDRVAEPSADFRFAAAVAEFGMLLRDSPYKGKATFDQALSLAESGRGEDVNGDRGEFISLVKSMQRIATAETVSENH
ncbi:MAG TPA: von Willebrand factor type A domain-containing protein [Gemmatimonadaceae bacterium]|nr:von Willebrand factor type A domain-containing protein [Gemmatimonadaceae bacterium]